tara:strand:- start:2051 stop:2443 length:393 start_codon:yes stop_codon:yes gene_type:complete
MKNKKIVKLSESDLYRIINKVVNEDQMEYWSTQDDEGNNVDKLPVDDVSFDLSDSDYEDIADYQGPKRRFRGSIYYDGMVPESDDVEYDRAVAQKILDYERKKLKNMETFTGGVGFKTGSLSDPYDNMEF